MGYDSTFITPLNHLLILRGKIWENPAGYELIIARHSTDE